MHEKQNDIGKNNSRRFKVENFKTKFCAFLHSSTHDIQFAKKKQRKNFFLDSFHWALNCERMAEIAWNTIRLFFFTSHWHIITTLLFCAWFAMETFTWSAFALETLCNLTNREFRS